MDEGSEFRFGQAHAVGVAVFGDEVRMEHGGVVGGKNDRNSVAEEFGEGMGLDGHVLLGELARESAGQDVAGGAEFEGDAAVGKEVH